MVQATEHPTLEASATLGSKKDDICNSKADLAGYSKFLIDENALATFGATTWWGEIPVGDPGPGHSKF